MTQNTNLLAEEAPAGASGVRSRAGGMSWAWRDDVAPLRASYSSSTSSFDAVDEATGDASTDARDEAAAAGRPKAEALKRAPPEEAPADSGLSRQKLW